MKKINNGVDNTNIPEKIFSFVFALKSTIYIYIYIYIFFLIIVHSYVANGAGGHKYGGHKCKIVTVQTLETFGGMVVPLHSFLLSILIA